MASSLKRASFDGRLPMPERGRTWDVARPTGERGVPTEKTLLKSRERESVQKVFGGIELLAPLKR